ncbi:MAG TPA: twin transmembrane helix small protein [Alphaproteobacteria bacterium]|jgi:hypothetical protein|nr:twin transmembrane helix small protein [Alphaproteobacteria bacterium]
MAAFATFTIPVLMAGVLIVLIAGIVNLSRKGHDPRLSQKLMRWRVILQGAAILIFLALMLLAGHT